MKKELKTIPELTKRHKDILLYGEYLNEHLAKIDYILDDDRNAIELILFDFIQLQENLASIMDFSIDKKNAIKAKIREEKINEIFDDICFE